MFLRKLTVILVPLGMLLFLCLLIQLLFSSMDAFFGPLLLGAVLGVMLSLLLPLAGATRLREPFAWQQLGRDLPVLRLLVTGDARIIITESAFASYMLTFSLRTGKGI